MHKDTPTASTAGPPWWLLLLAAAGIAAGLYLWQTEPVPRLPTITTAPPQTAPADGTPESAADAASRAAEADAANAGPKFPLPEGAEQADASTMPAVDQSDPPILEALLALAPRETLGQFFNLQDYARRFVVTVDHLPRQQVPAQWNAARAVPGALAVQRDGDRVTLTQENFHRYDALVRFVESIDPKAAVKVYLRFYPLLQQQYQEMGFPQGHLNDRVIAAIDDMLTAPEVSGPIRLVQPKVQYRFEDPLLESLSAGRKMMIRIGPENAAKLKQVLQAVRGELAR